MAAMTHKTHGIVLGSIQYSETSIIAKIFTKALGLQAYIIHRVRVRKPRYSIALFQPLTLLDMVVYHKNQRNVQRVAEVQCHTSNNDILTNIKKATMAIFVAEFLIKVLREEGTNEQLFNFLWWEIVNLNKKTADYDFFYLTFLLQLSHYLGFGISSVQDIYIPLRRSGQYWKIDRKVWKGLTTLLPNREYTCGTSIPKVVKRHILDVVIQFYQLHIDSLDTLKSLRVLQELD